jgi:23S rRNA pseudouridine1911/1915/1917 synthase
MKAIGHPVVGDGRYGGGRSQVGSPRVFLHAARLGFEHPRTGAPVGWDSPLPDDLAAVLAEVRATSA